MTTKNQTILSKDIENKRIKVVREFAAPVKDVWEAWTDASLLDQWWAPKPWKAITKSMDFREGGHWLYYMSGPDGEQIWNRVDFITIDAQKSLITDSYFCDEAGNNNFMIPVMHWKNQFHTTAEGSKVEMEITFTEAGGIEKIVEMGFEEGFTAALENLDEILEK